MGGGVDPLPPDGGSGGGGLNCCPGTHPETICEEPANCDGGAPVCHDECVLDTVCPPGTTPVPQCDPMDPMNRWTSCEPKDVCPPDTVPVTECDPMNPMNCWTSCEPR